MAGGFLDRTVDEVMRYAKGQIRHPTPPIGNDWDHLCQAFCRSAYDVDAWAPSAILAWGKIPRTQKHARGNPSAAPRGALLYFAGGKYGHVMIAAGIKTHDKAISNDYVRQGQINYCPRTIPRWGLRYLGWSNWTPFGELKVGKQP
jgi:hypothetical protein